MPQIEFHAADLVHAVERLPEAEIDTLPFGVIKMDRDGKVLFYSQTERDQSGYMGRPALGLNFFTQIAPSMNVPTVKGRIDAALRFGEVDVEVGCTGDFDNPDMDLVIRCQSASDGGLWVFVSRGED